MRLSEHEIEHTISEGPFTLPEKAEWTGSVGVGCIKGTDSLKMLAVFLVMILAVPLWPVWLWVIWRRDRDFERRGT